MNFRGGDDCCVVLKSRTEFYAFADSQTPFITLRGYYHNVIEQQVNFLIQLQHNIAYAMAEIS